MFNLNSHNSKAMTNKIEWSYLLEEYSYGVTGHYFLAS